MFCLVPLDTSNPSNVPAPPLQKAFTIDQALGLGVSLATFDLTGYGLTAPPSNIVASLIKTDGTKSNISVYPRAWTASSFTCDFSSPTDDTTYVCSILVIP